MRITIEGSDFSEVPDGVYELDADTLEDFYMDTAKELIPRTGGVWAKVHRLCINGIVKGPKPDQRKRVLKEALELLWETQVAGEVQTEATDGAHGTPPGSFWIEDLETRSGLKDIDRHGWTQEDYV